MNLAILGANLCRHCFASSVGPSDTAFAACIPSEASSQEYGRWKGGKEHNEDRVFSCDFCKAVVQQARLWNQSWFGFLVYCSEFNYTVAMDFFVSLRHPQMIPDFQGAHKIPPSFSQTITVSDCSPSTIKASSWSNFWSQRLSSDDEFFIAQTTPPSLSSCVTLAACTPFGVGNLKMRYINNVYTYIYIYSIWNYISKS